MANNQAFCVTYGGTDRYGNRHTPYKAIAHSANEAIAVINTWHSYGRSSGNIEVNERSAEKIREIFREKNVTGVRQLRTTGCGCWDISFYPAMADTIEEHTRIYNEHREAAKKERLRKAEEARQRRLAELNVHRQGWYHTELDVRVMVFNNRGNDYFTDLTFSGKVIADSGMDAYDKAMKHVQDHPEELVHRGNIASLHCVAEPFESGFSYTFLGMKTDEGYSVEKWEEAKVNGEI